MKIPKSPLPKLKVNPATVQKVGVAAVGLGSALLIATDSKFRRLMAGELKNLLEKIEVEGEENAFQSRKSRVTPSSSADSGKTPSGGNTAGFVYLLKAGPFYKIGMTTDMSRRVKQFNIQLPYKAEVIHLIEVSNMRHVEKYWHHRFARRRQHGEWFVLTDEEVAEMKGYARM